LQNVQKCGIIYSIKYIIGGVLMKTRFYIILIILSITSLFSIFLIKPSIEGTSKTIKIVRTLSSYTKEVNEARKEFSNDTSDGYKFYPGGQEKFDEKYSVITEKRQKFYNSTDLFTKYFSNLTTLEKTEFLVSRIIAIIFYTVSIVGCILFWLLYAITKNKKSKNKKRRNITK
jgi:hypothetical protein